MAGYMNLIIMGNLVKDPELRVTNNGTSICEFTIAVNSKKENDDPYYGVIVSFSKTAENCKKYLTKGKTVLVDGTLKTEKWIDKETNKTRQKTIILANNVQFIGGQQNVEKNIVKTSQNENNNTLEDEVSCYQPGSISDEDVPF